jgi:hypothetical protein
MMTRFETSTGKEICGACQKTTKTGDLVAVVLFADSADDGVYSCVDLRCNMTIDRKINPKDYE